MASTTSNTDLVPKEALDELKALDAQAAKVTKTLEGLLTPVSKLVNELSKTSGSFKALAESEKQLESYTKKYTEAVNEQTRIERQKAQLQQRLADLQSKEAQEVANLKEQIRQQTQETRNQAKESLAAANSIEALRARVAALKTEWAKADMGSVRFKELEAQLAKATAQLSATEQKVGIYGRNVGNYASAFNPLQSQIQQVARELPSLTVSAQQFFFAISNKLPMLVGEMERARAANEKLRAEGQKGVPVWKQMVTGILGWQTALVVGGILLTKYGKEIGNFFSELFTGGPKIKSTTELVRDLNKAVSEDESIQGKIVKVRVLSQQWNELGDNLEAKKRFIKENAAALNEVGEGIDTVNEAETVLKNNTEDYVKALVERSMAEVAIKKATEYILEYNEARDNMKEGPDFWQNVGIGALAIVTGGAYNIGSWYKGQAKDMEVANGNMETATQEAVSHMTQSATIIKGLGLNLDKTSQAEQTLMNARIKNLQDEARAQREMQLSLLQESAEYNKSMVQNEKIGFEERLDALDRFIEQSQNAVKTQADNEISELMAQKAEELGLNQNSAKDRQALEKATASQVAAIRNAMNKNINDIEKEGKETREGIARQEADEEIRQIERAAAAGLRRDKQLESTKLSDATSKYTTNLDAAGGNPKKAAKAREEYEAEVTKITREAEMNRLQTAVNVAQSILDKTESLEAEGLVSKEEVEEAQAKLDEAGLQLARENMNQAISIAEEQSEKEIEIEQEKAAKKQAIWEAVFKVAGKLGAALFESAQNRLDAESEANQEWADEQRQRIEDLEESGAISKEQANARKAAVDAQEEQREKELSRKKAQLQKQQSIFEILLNTASAIVAAWVQPYLAPFIIPVIAATGAAELAIAMATPIPEYAAGTRNHPGGLAVVGDGGRPEVVMTPSGGLFRTPASDTLVDLPARSVVFPSVEEAMKNLDLFVPSVADAIDSLDPLPKIDSRPDNRTIINIDVDRIVNTQEKNTRVLNQILFGVNRDRANRRFYTLRANLRHTKTFN